VVVHALFACRAMRRILVAQGVEDFAMFLPSDCLRRPSRRSESRRVSLITLRASSISCAR
jgi:hypothetical protein